MSPKDVVLQKLVVCKTRRRVLWLPGDFIMKEEIK